MIQQLSVKNFRVFKEETTLKLAPLTILTGTNNSGKSSINLLIEFIKELFADCDNINDLLNKSLTNTELIKKFGGVDNLFTKDTLGEGLTFSISLYLEELYDYVSIEITISSELKITNFVVKSQVDEKQLLEIFYGDGCLCNINLKLLKEKLIEINVFKYCLYDTIRTIEEDIKNEYGQDFEILKSEIENSLLSCTKEKAVEIAEKKLETFIAENKRLYQDALSNLSMNKKAIGNIDYYPEITIDIDFEEINIEIDFFVDDRSSSTHPKSLSSIDFYQSIPQSTDFFNFSFLFESNNEDFNTELKRILVKEFGEGLTNEEYLFKINDLLIDQLSQDFELNYHLQMLLSKFYSARNHILDIGMMSLFFDVEDTLGFNFTSLQPKEKYFNSSNFIEKFKFLCILKWTHNESFLFDNNNNNNGFIISADNLLVGNNDFAKLDSVNSDLFGFIKKNILEKYFFKVDWIKDSLNSIDKISTIKTLNKRNHAISDSDSISKIVIGYINLNQHEQNKCIEELNKIVRYFEIGNSVEIAFEKIKDSYSIYLVKDDNQKYLIDDNGHGIMQLIPLCLQIILSKKKNKIFLLEEPEVGLHPANQSKLAEVIAKYCKLNNIQFIIETHSEYFIRKLQLLVANTCSVFKKKTELQKLFPEDDVQELFPEDVQIYYFYPPNKIEEGAVQVFPINIDIDGSLSESFGKGFFDESSLLNIQLFQYSSTSKN